jgi:hypothetical protein
MNKMKTHVDTNLFSPKDTEIVMCLIIRRTIVVVQTATICAVVVDDEILMHIVVCRDRAWRGTIAD